MAATKTEGKPYQKLNGAQLKYMVFVSMLLDHVNNAIVTPYLTGSGPLLHISNLLSILGRIAFPIFMFFLVVAAGLGYLSIIKELWSGLGFLATLTYNGERGKQYKWLNYAFYPVHILILAILRFVLNV